MAGCGSTSLLQQNSRICSSSTCQKVPRWAHPILLPTIHMRRINRHLFGTLRRG